MQVNFILLFWNIRVVYPKTARSLVNLKYLFRLFPDVFIRFLGSAFHGSGFADVANGEFYSVFQVLRQEIDRESTDRALVSPRFRHEIANFIKFLFHNITFLSNNDFMIQVLERMFEREIAYLSIGYFLRS